MHFSLFLGVTFILTLLTVDWVCQNWRQHEPLLDLVKSLLLDTAPRPFHLWAREHSEGLGHHRVVLHKTAKELPELLPVPFCCTIGQLLHSKGDWSNTIIGYIVTKVLKLSLDQLSL